MVLLVRVIFEVVQYTYPVNSVIVDHPRILILYWPVNALHTYTICTTVCKTSRPSLYLWAKNVTEIYSIFVEKINHFWRYNIVLTVKKNALSPFTYIKHRAVANGFRNTNQPPNQMDFEKWPPYAEMETKGLRERAERERERAEQKKSAIWNTKIY